MTILLLAAPFQTSYTIQTNCDNLVVLLCLKYGKYIKEGNKKGDQVISVNKQQDWYMVTYQDKVEKTRFPLQQIDRILFENTHYDDMIFALHGAAIAYEGKAYLFLASTTSGKTTLASYLSSSGFDYLTDDCILLDRTSFYIHPYNTPIYLRTGGVEVLKQYDALPQNLVYLDDPAIERYIYTPQNCVEIQLPLEKIFFIERTDHANKMEEMNKIERMELADSVVLAAFRSGNRSTPPFSQKAGCIYRKRGF